MDPDKYLQGIIDKHLRAKGIPHYSGPNTNLHQIPDHVKGEIDIILQTNPNIVTANISSYEKMQTKKIKEPEQQFKAEEYEIDDNWWEEKQENFDPFYTRTLKMRRDLPAIQRLAASENKSIQVTFSNGGRSGVNLADGIAFFDFHRGISNALKKVIILHEAAHLSITPHFNKLDPVDRDQKPRTNQHNRRHTSKQISMPKISRATQIFR
jgi:hypothetical protein